MSSSFSRRFLAWSIRIIYILAVLGAFGMLVLDSPVSGYLKVPVRRAVIEAAPLLLVGIAFLAFIAFEHAPVINLIKQFLIAVAFILWGIDLLLPTGQMATFLGAVVIAIYVLDLAWFMEEQLRKKFASS